MNGFVKVFAFCLVLAPLGIPQTQRSATVKPKFKAIWSRSITNRTCPYSMSFL